MSHSTLALPAPDHGWILYSGGSEIGRGEDLRSLVGKRRDVVIGLPASCVTTFVVDLPPVEASLHESMIHAQVEKRGYSSKGGTFFDYERIHRTDKHETFAVWVVSDLPQNLIVPSAAGYTTSAALRSIAQSESSCALWREHGKLVLSVYVEGLPAHFQVLSGKPEIGAAIGKEVNLLLLGLRGESVFVAMPPLELHLSIAGISEKEYNQFQTPLPIPVKVEKDSPAASVKGRDRLLPAAVKLARRKKRAVVRNLALVTVGAIIYTVVGVWVWKDAQATQREIHSLEHRISIIEPDVERIQLAEQRWRSLEPAFNKDLFPVLQLSRITAALPGSGVVVREYRTTERTVRIRGQARDVQLANRLYEDLQSMAGFETYNWSLPNPKVEKNNTATFEIEGKPKNEGTDS